MQRVVALTPEQAAEKRIEKRVTRPHEPTAASQAGQPAGTQRSAAEAAVRAPDAAIAASEPVMA